MLGIIFYRTCMLFMSQLRFGKAVKDSANTNIFEHAGRAFAITENHLPYEININNLSTLGSYNINGAWDQPFTSHPKVCNDRLNNFYKREQKNVLSFRFRILYPIQGQRYFMSQVHTMVHSLSMQE
jgi:carotenoid cleavage dioxygenase-like enzyme